MAIRILHVVDSLGKGGLENGLVNLIQRLGPGAFEHVVCAIRRLGSNVERLPDGVRVVCLATEGKRTRVQVPAMARVIQEFQPDIVHSRNWGAIEGVFAGRWAGSCALVHSEHGLASESDRSEPRRRTWLRRLAFGLADRVVAVSEQLRQHHARRTGFPERRIAVIHNGVDNQRFRPNLEARACMRHELGLSDSDFCIGAVGNLFPVKDHMTLLRAANEFGRRPSNWRLLVIGDGPELPRLEEFAAAQPALGQRVSFLRSSDRVPELLEALDAYVLSSVFEGISNSLLEAMATGIPVVATAVGGNPEVVVNGVSGLLFPAADAASLAGHLETLRAGPEMRARLGREAQRRVGEHFSLVSMVRQYAQLYESLRPALAAPERATVGA
jgi:sugar transferase (PEP-CTERM/EpsH1 system associated)